jgi:hypothetical protein
MDPRHHELVENVSRPDLLNRHVTPVF